MYTSPYNLNLQTENPVQFYDDLQKHSKTVVSEGVKRLSKYTEDFAEFIHNRSFKEYHSNEYLMELLMAGTFWNNYYQFLSINAIFYKPLFNKLYNWRKKFKSQKTRIDSYRGKLAYGLLAKERNYKIDIYKRFEFLNSWLCCTKEFNQELERLENWRIFLETKNVSYHEKFWSDITAFAKWFEENSELSLGKYTSNWEEFMMDSAGKFNLKEDYFFSTRKPNEYHLNMVAAEIMNQCLKPDFNSTKEKVLLLPKCMTKNNNCQAKMEDKQFICTNCSSDCNVSKLKNKMNKQEIMTVLIPHSSSFSEYLKPYKNSRETGLIGVACVLNLIAGAYEMQKLNIPSQCVFLDSCGCEKHWLSGNPTNINVNKLNNILLHEESRRKVNSTC
ncbi:MAG: DUF116 domain-containing protein [Salinivirgaceae bacterium]|nr:DUF116 domain-containing protein [Salinivirgaceae bacterium]